MKADQPADTSRGNGGGMSTQEHVIEKRLDSLRDDEIRRLRVRVAEWFVGI